jgi:NhaA family Na+:H+ antiporter
MVLTKLFIDFFNSERAGGLILICCTVISLVLSNVSAAYVEIWHWEVAGHHVVHWINDGLMTIFFLLIGLELEREIYHGELSSLENAALPVMAAAGGMALPALVYYLINADGGNLRGIGVPMATDIAFALGVLSLMGNRVPAALKIFLAALAVIDDLGAIIVIAIFYTHTIHWILLGSALAIFVVLLILNRLGVRILLPYLIGGVAMWLAMLNSGVHATITGVLLAFAIPFGNGDEASPSYRLQHFLHKPVAFLILPVFALANTSIIIQPDFYKVLGGGISLGIIAGLLVGKPVGILLFSALGVLLRWGKLPENLGWGHIAGAGLLGGIGFTMSIFISMLAFGDAALIDEAKMAVMIGSLAAGLSGFVWLRIALRQR